MQSTKIAGGNVLKFLKNKLSPNSIKKNWLFEKKTLKKLKKYSKKQN